MIKLFPHEVAALKTCEARIPSDVLATDTAAISEAIKSGDTLRLTDLFSIAEGRFGQPYPLLLVTKTLAAVPLYYRQLDLPSEQYQGTLADIRRWMDTYSSYSNQAVGLPHPSWIARILTARIYHLGSLQVEERAFTLPYRIYQNKDGALIIFAEADLGFDSEGYLTQGKKAAHSTVYQEDSHWITAHRLDTQRGTVSLLAERYPRADLHLITSLGTPMLYTHIPARTDLSARAVDASFARAREVFGEAAQFFTVTWLVDPALALVTDSESRIRSFMERFLKFSLPIAEVQLYEKVFAPGYSEEMIREARATTTLQRRVQRALENGARFRTTGGYLAPEL